MKAIYKYYQVLMFSTICFLNVVSFRRTTLYECLVLEAPKVEVGQWLIGGQRTRFLSRCLIFLKIFKFSSFVRHLPKISRRNWQPSLRRSEERWVWFLAVQNSSIGDLVTDSLTKDFTNWHTKSNPRSHPRDLWPLRHLFRVMRRHDMTKKNWQRQIQRQRQWQRQRHFENTS